MIVAIIMFLRNLVGWIFNALRSRQDLILENLAFRGLRLGD